MAVFKPGRIDAVHSRTSGMNRMDYTSLSDPAKAVGVANRIILLCQRTAGVLAKDIRAEMLMPPLVVSNRGAV